MCFKLTKKRRFSKLFVNITEEDDVKLCIVCFDIILKRCVYFLKA